MEGEGRRGKETEGLEVQTWYISCAHCSGFFRLSSPHLARGIARDLEVHLDLLRKQGFSQAKSLHSRSYSASGSIDWFLSCCDVRERGGTRNGSSRSKPRIRKGWCFCGWRDPFNAAGSIV